MMKGHEASRHKIFSDKLESKKGLTWMKWYFFGEKMGRIACFCQGENFLVGRRNFVKVRHVGFPQEANANDC